MEGQGGKMDYNVGYFIKFFGEIPDDKWLAGQYGYGGSDAPHCAIGHCTLYTDRASALRNLFSVYLGLSVPNVNDGRCTFYQQRTPKQRILAALTDIKNGSRPGGGRG